MKQSRNMDVDIKNSEHFPSSRKIVDDNHWLDEFKLRRSDDVATTRCYTQEFQPCEGKTARI